MRSTLWPLAAVVLVAVILAGCSNAPAGPGVGSDVGSATATPAAPTGAAGGGATTTSDGQQAVKFAECMRTNGVPAFPDPDASGVLTIDGIVNGSSLDPNSAAWTRAMDACRDLEPAGFTGHKRTAQQQANALKFAACIRENGVKDFPDPDPDAPLVDTNRIPSSGQSGGMSLLNAAMHKCGALANAAMGQ
jgi:predicted small secreted protein